LPFAYFVLLSKEFECSASQFDLFALEITEHAVLDAMAATVGLFVQPILFQLSEEVRIFLLFWLEEISSFIVVLEVVASAFTLVLDYAAFNSDVLGFVA